MNKRIKDEIDYKTWMEVLASSMARMVEWSSAKSVLFPVNPCIFGNNEIENNSWMWKPNRDSISTTFTCNSFSWMMKKLGTREW